MSITCSTGAVCLLDLQQSDGGWAYGSGCSWTEPTAYSLIALRSAGGSAQAVCRASEWLARKQRRDGGWSPGPAVEQSTHVTSLAVLGLSGLTGYEDITEHGVRWLIRQSGMETSIWARIARLAMGTNTGATEHTGWPWFPGAAAWVIPTALAVCALSHHRKSKYEAEVAARFDEARRFLLSRQCPDHGWNHGGLFRAGETPLSYPETTGIALVALAATGGGGADLDASIRCAEQHAKDPKSSEGANWLRLGFVMHRREVGVPAARHREWTVNQVALRMIAEAAEAGRNPLIAYVR